MEDTTEGEELLLQTNESDEEDGDGKETLDDKMKQEDHSTQVPKTCCNRFLDVLFPALTSNSGKTKLTRKRSCLILFLLYTSHIFSAWGDRMWGFANSLVVVLLYPGSLLLPGIYGFITTLFVVIFGTIVGDLVDTNSRLKVISVSLIVQNGLVLCSAVLFSLMFYNSWDVCGHALLFGCLMVLVIISASISKLATVANTISIEKDWVVVIADKNSTTLAILNANMRRIDLLCKLLAPIVAGVLLTHTQSLIPSLSPDLAGGFAATVIIGLWNVVSFFGELGLLIIVYRLVPALAIKKLRKSSLAVTDDNNHDDDKPKNCFSDNYCCKLLKKLASPYRVLITGWRTFWKQEINLTGFALASLYLTVLGFSGVTATYFLTQGLTSDYIGLAQGLGGVVGIAGTLLYPFLHRKLGTVRTGLFGTSAQVLVLLFCVVGVFIPGKTITSTNSDGYYSPNCSIINNNTINPSPTIDPFSSSYDILPSMSDDIDFVSTTTYMSPTPSSLPPPTDATSSSQLPISVSVILLLVGVTGARFGLWIFDLSVWQLVQEKVVEEERGVVSGVMNAMNSNMDMLHYVMVIIAPRPQDFRYLTLISYASVFMGFIFYCFYVRRARGHFFHFSKIFRKIQRKGHVHRNNEEIDPKGHLTLVNPNIAQGEEDEEFEL